MTNIQAVTTSQDREMFLDVPKLVYADDPNWVSPLRSDVAKKFDPSNPFFNYGKMQQFIAVNQEGKKKQAVGRIVAAINQRLIARESQNIGLFGFFECVPDFTIAKSLFDAACQWLQEQGMTRVRGPIDLSTHNSCFFLVNSFDSPPMVMMPYNPPYYPEFIEQDGWEKAKDAYAYDFPLNQALAAKFEKAYRIACKSGITFRPLRTKGEGFEQDVNSLYDLFNRAFANNWSSTTQ